ncbi:MAG: aminoacyl-tRNA hydrolase [Actinobacteria bacterium]|nr:aminoacyl-tRNA hydrolase [Actinomycetota bacterium]
MNLKKTWLIVGLGNPGSKYSGTRHNIGASAVASIANALSEKSSKHKRVLADVCETRIAEHRVVLAVPHSYMNESGGAVAALLNYYNLSLETLIVLHDELDIPALSLRVKFGGGDNGHNGLKSIRSSINSGDFYRVRMGIGRPQANQDPADYVLQNFSSVEKVELSKTFNRAHQLIESLIVNGLAQTQNEFHRGED